MPNYTLGIDFGKERDFSALILTETVHIWRPGSEHLVWTERNLPRDWVEEEHVRFIERMPLKTSYTAVVDRMAEILSSVELRGSTVAVYDRTGVGNAVRDMITQAYRAGRLGAIWPVGVTITSGAERHGYNVPKADLVAALVTRLENGRIRYPDEETPLIRQLRHELAQFRVRMTKRGADTFEAAREADHDDLVIALALAVWHRHRKDEPRRIDERALA